MNILIIAHFHGTETPTPIFIHEQSKAFINKHCNVRMIVPIALGKKDYFGNRFGKLVRRETIDGLDIFFVKYISLSKYGEKYFNHLSCIMMIKIFFRRLCQSFNTNIIHAHTIGFESEIGAYLKKRLFVPLFVTTHGSDTSVPIEAGKKKYIMSRCDKANVIVAVSSVLRAKLLTTKTTTPIEVILNGFNLNNVSRIDYLKIPLTFLQVGNLIKQKCVDITINAFALIKKEYPTATLTIIGEGPEKETLLKLCNYLNITDDVRFLGRLSNELVLKEMSRTQFFCMPSYREGFGIVYLEAMASGCITIGSVGEGISDLIVDEVNGILVEPKNSDALFCKIMKCLKFDDLSLSIAKNGIATTRDMTWENNAKNYLDLFQEYIRS